MVELGPPTVFVHASFLAAMAEPVTNLWLTDGAEYLGRLAVRHCLIDRLLQAVGHIAYDVRVPTA